MVFAPTVTRAMAQQVERVNSDPAALLERLRQAESALELARVTIRKQRAEIVRLSHARFMEEHVEAPGELVRSAAMRIDNRPVLTPAQASTQYGVSVSTVSRYVSSGYWPATQQPGSNRWFIFADVPLTLKHKR